MESSVGWICVFCLAEFAHFEILHCGVLSVIWEFADCGVAWSAIGACNKEIVVSRVFWVAEFS